MPEANLKAIFSILATMNLAKLKENKINCVQILGLYSESHVTLYLEKTNEKKEN